MCNFLLAVAIQFQEIFALPSHIQMSVCKLNKRLSSMVDETLILFYLVYMYEWLVIPGAHILPNSRKNDLILIMTPEKQDKTLDLSKHWSLDSTPARNEVIMKTTYPVNQ